MTRAEQIEALLSYIEGQPRGLRVTVRAPGQRLVVRIPAAGAGGAAEVFIPSDFQARILAALDGRGLRTDALAGEVGDRRALFRHPGGLRELREQGLVASHPRLGYYRTDAPPPQLETCPKGASP